MTAADHLAWGYALTVHRSQGTTVDSVHLYADGGGRQLGYVAMSRARQHSTGHAVTADTRPEALTDLERAWSLKRSQRGTTRSSPPSPAP